MTVSEICNRASTWRRLLMPATMLACVAVAAWSGDAHARFTCSTNDDCAATANQCDPGRIPCNDGICSPNSPQADAIGCVLIPNDDKCDDGNFCNGVQECSGKHGCEDPVIPNCDDGIACTLDSCSAEANACVNEPRNSLCNNGLFCDGRETCDPGEGCVSGAPPNCADSVACTVDACNEATDSCTSTPNNGLCSNGQFCDGVEICDATLGCRPGTPPNCNDNIGCTADSCNEAIDACDHVANNGLCGDNVSCTVDICDVATGCKNTPNNASCSNGQFCDGVEICNITQGCLAGIAPNCSDNVVCTIDTCVEATDSCSHTVSNAACSNGQFCDGVETCSPTLGCRPGTAPNCNDRVSCTTDSCNEATDTCNNVVNDASCSNGLFCDGMERCDAGRGCLPPVTTACNDGVGCTVDLCTEATDTCRNLPFDSNCDNDKFCDGIETCDPIDDCQAGTPPNCADNVECTFDRCVEATDSCAHVENDAACSNGLFCDGVEQCEELLGCFSGPPVTCSDGVICTVDTCIEETDSCTSEASDAFCDNDLFCDGTETCDPELDCQDGPVPDCTDQIPCTVDTCSNQAGSCLFTPDHEECTDDVHCNGDEICDPLIGCMPGPPPVCNDSLTCTDDFCVEAGDTCRFDPNGALCGNDIFEPQCGEECDGNDGEICNNEIDDDGDTLVDCQDPDCAEGTEPTCDEECMLVSPCLPLARDPAVISWGESETRAAGAPGAFSFHARLMAATPLDPTTEGVVVTLRNIEGEIFRAELEPSKIKAKGARFYFVSKDRDEVARTGGFVRLGVRKRLYAGEVGYGIRVQAYGDFSRATLARMTTQVYFGNDIGFVTADWTGEPGRWILRPKDYEGGLP